jgi:hypothetical protein
VANVIVPEIHRSLQSTIQDSVTSEDFCGLSFCADGWQDHNKSHIIGITIHYVDSRFNLHSKVLDLLEMSERQTSDAIRAHLQQQLNDLLGVQLSDTQIHCGTVDGAANYQKAVADLLDVNSRLHCLCHVIDLAVEDIISKVRLVSILNSS